MLRNSGKKKQKTRTKYARGDEARGNKCTEKGQKIVKARKDAPRRPPLQMKGFWRWKKCCDTNRPRAVVTSIAKTHGRSEEMNKMELQHSLKKYQVSFRLCTRDLGLVLPDSDLFPSWLLQPALSASPWGGGSGRACKPVAQRFAIVATSNLHGPARQNMGCTYTERGRAVSLRLCRGS